MSVLHSLSVSHVGPKPNIQVISFSVLRKVDYFILGILYSLLKIYPDLFSHMDIKFGYTRAYVKDDGIMLTE